MNPDQTGDNRMLRLIEFQPVVSALVRSHFVGPLNHSEQVENGLKFTVRDLRHNRYRRFGPITLLV